MYELIILTLLLPHPLHGYKIAQVVNNIVGPFAKVSNGRLYPLLTKLTQDGLIVAQSAEEAATSGRHSRVFMITEAGRTRFRVLMLDTSANPGEYAKLFLYKARALHLLTPTERLYLIDHYCNFCQAHILHLDARIADLVSRAAVLLPAEAAASVGMMRHVRATWELEWAWAKDLRAQEMALVAE